HRGHVDEAHAEALGDVEDTSVAGAEVSAAGFRVAAEGAHRMDAAANAFLRLEHDYVEPCGFELQCCVEARKPRADDCYVVLAGQTHTGVSGTPPTAGLAGPGLPLRQQPGGQKSWVGPSDPSARRAGCALMRSTIRSLTIAT